MFPFNRNFSRKRRTSGLAEGVEQGGALARLPQQVRRAAEEPRNVAVVRALAVACHLRRHVTSATATN